MSLLSPGNGRLLSLFTATHEADSGVAGQESSVRGQIHRPGRSQAAVMHGQSVLGDAMDGDAERRSTSLFCYPCIGEKQREHTRDHKRHVDSARGGETGRCGAKLGRRAPFQGQLQLFLGIVGVVWPNPADVP